jgi:T-complex protein 1 subunit alpha
LVTELSDLDENQSFDPAYLGHAGLVIQERVADEELILIKVIIEGSLFH